MMCAVNPVTLVQMLSSLVFHTSVATEALQCRARCFALRLSFLFCALPAGFKLIFDLFSAALTLPHQLSSGNRQIKAEAGPCPLLKAFSITGR
jgi:hypothetical protein